MFSKSNVESVENAKESFVLITGATGGLGKAFAVECASRGWNLLLTDQHSQLLKTLSESLHKAYGVTANYWACDLTDPASRAGLFEQIGQEGLKFWALINVAGTDFEGPFYEQSRQHIRTIIRLNVEGPLEMIHALLSFRDPLNTFRIINVASLAAFYPMPLKATYAASKRFLLDFSLALGAELRELGATVTVLCPAGLPTTSGCVEAIDAQGWMGQLTTQNIGTVADMTLDYALRGKAVCIPGGLNQFLKIAGSLLPAAWVVNLVGWRWRSARQKRFSDLQMRFSTHHLTAFSEPPR